VTHPLPGAREEQSDKSHFALLLTGILLAMIIFPLVAFYLVSYRTTEKTILNIASKHSLEMLRNQRDYLTLELDQIEALASNLGQVDEISAALAKLNGPAKVSDYDLLATKARIGYLLSNYRNLNGLVSIDVFSLNGTHFHVGDSLAEVDERKDLIQSLWDRTVRSTETITWHGVEDNVQTYSSSTKVIAATKLLVNPDSSWLKPEPIGLLLINYSTDYLYNHFSAVSSDPKSYLLVLDGQRRLIFHPDKKMIGRPIASDFGQLITGPSGSFIQRIGGSDVLLSYECIEEKNWYIVSLVPKETLLATMGSFRKIGGFLLAVSLVLIVLYVRLFTQRVVAPIGQIGEGFRNFQLNKITPGWRMSRPKSLQQIADLVMWFNVFLESMEKRREADTQLRIAATTFESQEGMFIADQNDVVLQVNTAFMTITGYGAEDIVGKPSRLLYSEQNHDDFYRTMDQAILDSGAWSGEIWNRRKNQEVYPALLTITGVKSDSGAVTHYVSTLTDITELKVAHFRLKEMNERLEDRTRQAEEASFAKSHFLANMSHEIRTPMNGVIGMVSLLLGTRLDDKQRRFAESARISGASLLSLIDDILDLSKVEAGKLKLDEVDFDLNAALDEIATSMAGRAQDKKLEFRCTIREGTPRHLRGDPGRLKQVLVNLVGNGIKFTSSGVVEAVLEGVAETGEDVLVRFTVRDTGIGIPAGKLDTLFQSFSQGDPSTTRKYGGTGLGLAISRQLVTLLGGEIGVSSREGEGSEFWFTARFRRQAGDGSFIEPESARALEPMLRVQAPGRVRILLVEDNQVNQEVALAIMEQWGLAADTAWNGAEAVQALRRAHYDLVLMDVQMPEMDGLEATQTIRDPHSGVLDSTVPIIALTAHAMQEDRQRCLDAGMDGYLAKPITPEALASVLNRVLVDGERGKTPCQEPSKPDLALPVFDRQAFLGRVMGDENAAKRAVRAFLKDMPGRLLRIQDSLVSGDAELAGRELHTVKGASAALGGEVLKAQASEAGRSLKEGGMASLAAQFPAFLVAYEQFRSVLEQEGV